MKSQPVVYALRWSRTVRLMTVSVNLLLLAIPVVVLCVDPGAWPAGLAFGTCIGLPVWLTCRGYCPRTLELDGRNLTVRRRWFGDVVIPLRYIRYIRVIERQEVAFRSVRTGGSGGYYGYFGSFRSRRLKAYRLYAVNLHGLVYLVTENRNYVIGCPDPQAVVAHILQVIGSDAAGPQEKPQQI